MMEWFSNLTDFEKFYWIITGVSSLFFIFILITTFIGGDVDDVGDIDAEVDADTGVGFTQTTTIIISVVCGFIMMIMVALLMFYMRKLNDSGTLKMKNALGAVGEVYTTIGAERSKIGKVQIKVQSSLRDLEALTDYNTDLTQGAVVEVVDY